MDKFGMYRRVVRSCGPERPEENPQTPREVGGMIKNGEKNGPDINCTLKSEKNTENIEKPMSHSLRMFLESQSRHERLSREIDQRNGLAGEEE